MVDHSLMPFDLDNPVQCKLVPDKNNIQLVNLEAWIKNSKWKMERKLDISEKHALYKFTCNKKRPAKNLFEVRMEMGSEVFCKMFAWQEISLFEYNSEFDVSTERYEEILTFPFPFLENRRLEILTCAHFTPGHTVEYELNQGYLFVDLNHLTIEFNENYERPTLPEGNYRIKYEKDNIIVLKFNSHNVRDKYACNDSEYLKMKSEYHWTEHLGKFFDV